MHRLIINMDEIEEFINRRFKQDCDWLTGNCYYFAATLKIRFPYLEIVYFPVAGRNGRRGALKMRWTLVRVQVPLPLPTHADSLMLIGIYQIINRKLTRNSCISSDNCSDEAHNFNPLQGLLVCCYIRPNKLNRNSIYAVMAKLAYARDLESLSSNTVRVRISITAPLKFHVIVIL